MEVLWIGVPLLLGLVMFVWGAILFFKMYDPPVDALEVYVVGKQWMWHVQHSEGRAEINELHVPLGTADQADDDLAGRDPQLLRPGVPGETGRAAGPLHHDVVRAGEGRPLSPVLRRVLRDQPFDHGRLGLRHGAGRVSAMALPGGDGPSMAEQGERLFVQYHCAGCHRGSQTVHAPRLEGVYGRPVPVQQGKEVRFTLADYRYIRDSILRPKSEVVAGYEPVMPSFEGQITEPDLLKIIAYIKSIGAKEATQ